MSDKNNIYFKTLSDTAYLAQLGTFIKHHRLNQDKSQNQLATDAGINRSTLIEFEKGKRANLITFIQLLRALNLLYALEAFRIEEQLSPLQLAEIDLNKRRRASKIKLSYKQSKKNKSDW